jgi:hypothetical protein
MICNKKNTASPEAPGSRQDVQSTINADIMGRGAINRFIIYVLNAREWSVSASGHGTVAAKSSSIQCGYAW